METVPFESIEAFERNLIERAKHRRTHAYTPYSHFKVGSAIYVRRFRNGSEASGLFEGCNVENVHYEVAHAEEVAITQMISDLGDGEKKIPIIDRIAIVLEAPESDQHALPCGYCRQWIREFGTPETRILGGKLNRDGIVWTVEVTTLGELLPFDFGPQNLVK